MFRSESVEGFLSPSRCGSRNGEKDWENASTTSSVASATEYTGQWQQYSGKYLPISGPIHEKFSVTLIWLPKAWVLPFKVEGNNTRLTF